MLLPSQFVAMTNQCGKVFHPDVMTMRLTVVAVQQKDCYNVLAVRFRAQVSDDEALRRRVVAQHLDYDGGILSFEFWYMLGRYRKKKVFDVNAMMIR